MKILILETSAFKGWNGGGSYLSAEYYKKLLENLGYITEIFIGNSQENSNLRKLKVIRKIHQADLIIGFGTPVLCSYLQWLCLILRKRGIFCVDTVIYMDEVLKDNLKFKTVSKRVLSHYLISFIINKIFTAVLPPKLNLINIASCRFIFDRLKNTKIMPLEENFLYPRIEMKRRKRQNGKSKIVLFFGALTSGRGVINLFNACRLLWENGLKFKLYILAYPVDSLVKQELFNEIKEEEEKMIIFREKVDSIENIVRKASMVVLPFRYPCSFQTPYTLLESMAWRVPVITTNTGSNTEWVKDRQTGLICRKEDPGDIADKIEIVFKNKNLAKRITDNAYKLLEERYRKKDILLINLAKLVGKNRTCAYDKLITCKI